MKKMIVLQLVVIFLFLGMIAGNRQAISQQKTFHSVIPFVVSGMDPLIGLFDQNDGKVYIYNTDFSRILFKYQITDLGKPAVVVK